MTTPTLRALARKAAQVRQADPQAEVPSPCLSICRMDAHNALCEGCHRSLDEIAAWSGLDNVGRRAVWQRIEARLQREDAA